ncbi:glycosyl hydrolase 108 family protein [Acetobacter oeni]|uniref:TtsA-like Glycoside hydrolase family 108 domain-containing protein n=1 Tax=Acetobacter oeni TaxID=304077 RepID=A0A511XP53_9PROT|nr:glycosyl hydrolase 108 family protein [Acetobacter oeni]MBB3884503.1 lysozyme family protein [Acetobacter oeni]GEN64686.1 hypothetical protein AOE01nite_29100 [Acetobacter oeni]
MSAADLDTCIAFIGAAERGYQNNYSDPGNWSSGMRYVGNLIGTNYGISAPTLTKWMMREITPSDMRTLDWATARDIYVAWFWNLIHGDDLPSGLDLMGFDHAIMAGPASALAEIADSAAVGLGTQATTLSRFRMQILQRRLDVVPDGFYGPLTSAAIAGQHNQHPALRILYVSQIQEIYYRGLGGSHDFLTGWLDRLSARTTLALQLSDGASA